MGASERFDRYIEHLAQGLEHADRPARVKLLVASLKRLSAVCVDARRAS